MEDPIEKFRNECLKRKQANLHKPFFTNDKNLTHIPFSLLNDFSQKYVPFRNKKCRLPTCIYDINELVEKFRHAGYTDTYQFFCKFCEVPVILKQFVYDTTLAATIDKLWEINNAIKGAPKATHGKQLKDGNGEIVKPEVQSQKDLEQTVVPKMTGEGGRHAQSMNTLVEVKEDHMSESIILTSFPKITDFSKTDFAVTWKNFASSKNADDKKKVKGFGIEITKKELDDLIDDQTTSANVMAFFTRYIKNYLKICNPSEKDYIFSFIVNNYDKFEQKASFSYLQTFKNPFRNNPRRLTKTEESPRLFLVFKYDERWLIAVVDIRAKKCVMVDFLASDLSRTSKDEFYSVVKTFLKQEFNFKPNSVSFYDQIKSNLYTDCGLFVCRYLSNVFVGKQDILKQAVSEGEKNTFKSVLPWLILKTHLEGATDPQKIPKEENHNSYSNRVLPTELASLLDRSRAQTGGSNTTLSLANQLKTRQTRLLSQPLQLQQDDMQSPVIPSLKSQDSKVKIKRKKLEEMLNGIKDELYAESALSETQRVFDEESLFNNSRLSKESMNKDQIKHVIKRVEKLKKLKQDVSKVDSKAASEQDPSSPEEYYEKYMEYAKQANEFYGMLNYFQHSNPTLYQKVSGEIHGQIENKLLGKYNLLHLKQGPLNSASPDFASSQSRSSRFNMKLPPLSSLPNGNFNIGSQGRGSMASVRGSMALANGNFNIGATGRGSMVGAQSQPRLTTIGRKDTILESNQSQPMPVPHHITPDTSRMVAAKRYGVEVYQDEIATLKDKNIMAKSIIVFFFGFLQERHDNNTADELLATSSRILSLGPQFYDRLTGNNTTGTKIKYDQVESLTAQYQGEGNTIFESFDKIVFAVRFKADHYMLICIDAQDKRVVLLDPSGQQEQSPVNHPVIFNICQFIEHEYQNKADKAVNLAKWRFAYGDMVHMDDLRDSGLMILKIVHSIYMNAANTFISKDELMVFKNKLLILIQHIGVTKNKKNELGSFVKYPL